MDVNGPCPFAHNCFCCFFVVVMDKDGQKEKSKHDSKQRLN